MNPTTFYSTFLSRLRLLVSKTVVPVAVVIFAVPFGAGAADQKGLPPEISDFITRKEIQARAMAEELELKVSPDVWVFFKTAKASKTSVVTNAFERLKKRSSQYEGSKDDPGVGTPVWQMALEVELAAEAFGEGDPKYSYAFGNGVIKSLPRGCIYFGGTDPGRGIITALSKSHADGDPFFTITQNALADGRYLDYLRSMYGKKIRTPSAEDSQQAFQEYLQDAQKRLAHDQESPDEARQIKPGEDVKIANGRVQVSGQVAVMAINGLLVKDIFDANPDREFYIEESFPLDWMYPYLSPHGLILKLNRKPLPDLTEEMVKKDREFWLGQQKQILGDWLTPETPVKEVCDFARRVFARKDFSGFKGDRVFIENSYGHKMYSKLRSSVGGIYQWRVTKAKSAAERKRMNDEADFAFRQAFAFCPYSPEAVFRYVNLLLTDRRIDDALRIAMTAQILEPENKQVGDLVNRLQEFKKNSKITPER